MAQVDSIPAEVRERVHRIASDLYTQNGLRAFPALDEVRKRANVDMNVASLLLKEWRKIQPASAAPLAGGLPAAVREAGVLAIQSVWEQAQQLANQHLDTAQAAWQAERDELDALRAELAAAFEQQAAELEATSQQLSMVLALNARQQQELTRATPRLDASALRLSQGEAQAQLSRSYDEVSQWRQQCEELRNEGEGLRKTQADLQEELRVLRSDKESAHRAVASLRQQLQEATAVRTVPSPAAGEAAKQDAQAPSELEVAAYGQGVTGRLATSSKAADMIVRSR